MKYPSLPSVHSDLCEEHMLSVRCLVSDEARDAKGPKSEQHA